MPKSDQITEVVELTRNNPDCFVMMFANIARSEMKHEPSILPQGQ